MPEVAISRPLAVFQSEPAKLYELVDVSFMLNGRAAPVAASSSTTATYVSGSLAVTSNNARGPNSSPLALQTPRSARHVTP